MTSPAISYQTTARIDPTSARKLIQRGGCNDWFTPSDVSWYLRHALFIASAWSAGQCVGIAVLTGDGRINTSLDLLLVDTELQRRGIGSNLMKLILQRLRQLRPYHTSIEVFERRTQRVYARFGFVRNKGTWLLEHAPTAERLRRKAAIRRNRSKRPQR